MNESHMTAAVGFDALGKPVPESRLTAAYRLLKEWGFTTEEAMSLVGRVAHYVEVDALYVVRDEARRQRRRRRVERFNRYMERLRARPADTAETLAHFWVGQLFAHHGTDEQLDDWIRLAHGYPPL